MSQGNAGREDFCGRSGRSGGNRGDGLCPSAGKHMRIGEKMCDECKKKTEYEEEETDDPDKDDAWRSYLDDDVEDLGIPLPEDEFEDDDDEDEDDDDYDEDEIEKSKDDDDFEYVSADDY
ncbi:MAG: hypothetical protein ACLRSW_00905, partial [Christensenellaceae bacterium]